MFERCLYFNVNALARAVNRLWNEAFREFGLSPAHAYLLRLVLAEPGASQKQLAAELRLEKSTVTRFIDALQDKGLLTRYKSGAGDSREQHVHPSAKAKRLHQALEARGESLYAAICAELGEAEVEALVARLRAATQALS